MTARRPSLVVLDLDGTVLPYDGEFVSPSPRVRRALRRTVAAGVPVTVATGRPVWATLPTAAALGVDGVNLICSNGSLVFDPAAGVARHHVMMDPRPAGLAIAALAPDAGIAVEHGLAGYRHNRHFSRDFASSFVGQAELGELLGAPTSRLVCRPQGLPSSRGWSFPAGREASVRLMTSVGLDPRSYAYEVGSSGWIEVLAPGTSKASGAATVAADLGVDPADVMVIGDGHNDLSMFEWAGYAVAMGQAPEAVRAAVDEVAPGVEEDGAAVVLERWFG